MDESQSQDAAFRERIVGGDEAALGEAFAEYRQRLLRMLQFRMDPRLLSRVDADDVLQEAYLAAAQRLEHFIAKDDDSLSLFVWLRQITTQTLIDVHRRHIGAQKRDAGRDVSMHLRAPQATSASLAAQLLGRLTSPSQAALRDELAGQLDEALAQMEPIDQEVLALRHFEELSNSEVADVLGIQQKAASIRYIRAIGRLKSVLARIPGFEELRDS